MSEHARWYPLIPNPQGEAFATCQKRFQVVAAGRRSGKDERSKRKAIHRAILGSSFHEPTYRLCAPTLAQAKAIFWNDLKLFIPRKDMACDPMETELTIKLAHGPIICVNGLDKPQRIEGVPCDGFVFTETDDMKPGFWEEHLRPCLSDRLGWAIFNGVPEGIGFLYDLSKLALTDPEWAFFTWPSREVLPESEIESARRTMDPRTFRQEYEASFENATGRVYYAFDRSHNVKEPPPDLPLSVGMDFNVNPMSAVVFGETPTATYVVDEIVIQGRSNTFDMAQEIRNRYGQRVTTAYPDPTGRHGSTNAPVGRSDHEILKQAGFAVLCRGTSNVRDGINAVNSRLCSASGERRLFVAPKCKTLIEAFERHAYKDGTSLPDKNDGHDHILDAARYAVEYLHPVKERKEWAQ